MINWSDKAKRLLKSELAKQNVSHEELANLLVEIGIRETKSSIDSKISRGTFSAAFLLQCLFVLDCPRIELDIRTRQLSIAAEPTIEYQIKK